MIKLTNIFLSFSVLAPLSSLGISTLSKVDIKKTNVSKEYSDKYLKLDYTHNPNNNYNFDKINTDNSSFKIIPDKNKVIQFTKSHPNNKIDPQNNNDDAVVLNPKITRSTSTSNIQNSICGNYYTHVNKNFTLSDFINDDKVGDLRTKLIEAAPYFINGDNPADYHYSISLSCHYSYFIDFHNNSSMDHWGNAVYTDESQPFVPSSTMCYESSFGTYKDLGSGDMATPQHMKNITDLWLGLANTSGTYNGIQGEKWAPRGQININNFENNFMATTNFSNINLTLSDNFYYSIDSMSMINSSWRCEQFEIIATNVNLSIDSINFSWAHN